VAINPPTISGRVTDNVETVQSEEFIVGAELDYINSVVAHKNNLGKVS